MRENLMYGLTRGQGKQDFESLRPCPTLQILETPSQVKLGNEGN
jgi:hypothetical protein